MIRKVVVVALLAVTAAAVAAPVESQGSPVPDCLPGGGDVVMNGSVTTDDAKTYQYLPFDVAPGTTRIEVGYQWNDTEPAPPSTPITQSVFDLGLWDTDGITAVEGFRGWSGSRQGRIDNGQDPVFIQADAADRGYEPGPIDPGVWNVELGVAAVAPGGAEWEVVVSCHDPVTGSTPEPQPVDPTHVARDEPGWYHGDFHMHGFHSNPNAPTWPEFVQFARDAQLDFLPVTEYVTTRHHGELGPIQDANPDLVIWPGREIITYFGHANSLGETPNVIDYRHGFGDVTLDRIQRQTKADGALFQVNHPTIFPGPVFANFCRGCEFTLTDVIDWDMVDTIEVLTGPILVDDSDIGGPGASPVQIQQPFVDSAIDLWEEQLLAGHRVTAVSGSDDKLGPELGSSATAVFAQQLSRSALTEAIGQGRAYVRTRGVDGSPALEMTAVGPDGTTGMIGDTFSTEEVEVTVELSGADQQILRLIRDGQPAGLVPVVGDEFTHTFTADRSADSGPLGTFWRVDVLDAQSLTVISNPIFLTDASSTNGPDPGTAGGSAGDPAGDVVSGETGTLPVTGGETHLVTFTLLVSVAAILVAAGRIAKPRPRPSHRARSRSPSRRTR